MVTANFYSSERYRRGEPSQWLVCYVDSQHSVVLELRLNKYSPEKETKEVSCYMFIDLVISPKEKMLIETPRNH